MVGEPAHDLLFSLHGAWVVGAEDEIGSIEPGKFADMIVLDANLFEIDPGRIDETQVLRTVVGGNVVYDRPQDGSQDVDPDDMMDRIHH